MCSRDGSGGITGKGSGTAGIEFAGVCLEIPRNGGMVTYKAEHRADTSAITAAFIMAGLVIAGMWFRLSGLGDRVLAQDEYYFISSVHNILDSGVPRFPDGGYYFRGIVLQYLTALFILLLGDGHFAYRLPSALLGTCTLVMAYFLGRRFLDRSWSLLLVAMLAFSSWQVEFSLFSRMYAGFQFVVVCFFWSLYRYSFDSKSNKRYLTVAFAMLAILTHELGIFIAMLLFVPYAAWLHVEFGRTIRKQWLYLVASSVVLGLGLVQGRVGFRYIGVPDRLPPDFISPIARTPSFFEFGIGIFSAGGLLLLVAGAIACLLLGSAFYITRNSIKWDGEDRLLAGLLLLAVCFAVVYQFTISGLILLVVILRKPGLLKERPHKYLLGLLAMLGAFWFALLFFDRAWIDAVGLGDLTRTYLRSIRLAFFSFPDLYLPVFRAYADSIPILGSLLGLGIVWQVIHIRNLSPAAILKNPAIAILIVVIIMGFEPPAQIQTRYSHFLYPLALCAGLLSAAQLGEGLRRRMLGRAGVSKFLPMVLCVLAFGMSEDWNFEHLGNLKTDAVEFRMGGYEKYENHWYPRWDYREPAERVNAFASPSDRIIVSHKVNTAGAYLQPEFAVFWPWEDVAFVSISRQAGTRELWSGGRLLSTLEDVIEYTGAAEKVWLVVLEHKGDPLRIDPESVWPGRVQSVERFTPGRDKRIGVWKIGMRMKAEKP